MRFNFGRVLVLVKPREQTRRGGGDSTLVECVFSLPPSPALLDIEQFACGAGAHLPVAKPAQVAESFEGLLEPGAYTRSRKSST